MDVATLLGSVGFLGTLLVAVGAWQRSISRREARDLSDEIAGAKERGTDRPFAQFPSIDEFRCVGCRSCVLACPEEGVLGIVGGTARVIHGARCIGHGRCEEACPVGAITVGLGDASSRPDLPILTDDLETTVPGVFIAGELGGFALIRNAVAQGVRVIDAVARRLSAGHGVRNAAGRAATADALDVLIVGAGPAGFAATLRAKELGLRCRTIDQDDLGGTVRKYPRRKLTMTQPFDLPLHGRLTRSDYLKEELIELWEGIRRRLDLDIVERVKLLGLDSPSPGLQVARTSAGEVRARTVVLALGRRGTPRRLGVPGEESEKVLYQLVDAVSYTGSHILVVGGGDSAVEAGIALAEQPGNVVTLSYRNAGFTRIKPRNEEKVRRAAEDGRVRLAFSSKVDRIESGSVVLVPTVGEAREPRALRNDHVFVFAGGEPPYPLLRSMGIRFGGEEPVAA